MAKPPAPLLPDELKARVKRDFETTDASLRSLARRHGIKSENTIRRWRDAEGWRRDKRAITANLLTRAIALPDVNATTDEESEGESSDPALSGQVLQFPKAAQAVRTAAHTTNQGVSETDRSGSAPSSQASASSGGKSAVSDQDGQGGAQPARPAQTGRSRRIELDDEDRLDVSASRALAEIHARAIRKHSALADKIMATGASILDNVAILSSLDEDLQQAALARQRLTGVNTDKETLAGLARAATAVIKEGIKIQRQVLGMDLACPPGMDKASELEDVPESVTNRLPLKLLRELREVAAEQASIRPTSRASRSAGANAAAEPGQASGPVIEHGDTSPDLAIEIDIGAPEQMQAELSPHGNPDSGDPTTG